MNQILTWFRYIDDIFCVFNSTTQEANAFTDVINSFVPSLMFTPQISSEKVNFLDMTVMKSNGSIITSLYRKETDRNSLLLASSFHPTPLKKNLLISQFYRLKRICHFDENFSEQAGDIKKDSSNGVIHWNGLKRAFI